MKTSHTPHKIDPKLRLLLSSFLCGDDLIDVYGRFNTVLAEFDVVAVALAGDAADVTETFRDHLSDLQIKVDELGLGVEEVASRRAEAKDMQRDEWLGVGA